MKVRGSALILFAASTACSEPTSPAGPPPCGSMTHAGQYLVPGPGEAGFDAALEAKAARYDRTFHGLTAFSTGLNADLEVATTSTEARAEIEAFAADPDAWDFEAARGRAVTSVIDGWEKSTGLYAGAGLAADAFRYGVLRDQGYSCASIDLARAALVRGLESLHRASAISGVPGVLARSIARTDLPGDGARVTPTPLFDVSGDPLPPEKNNGTWRTDGSGRYPDWVWEDSMSRDMFVGWAMAFAAAWEVIRDDPTFTRVQKDTLQGDARMIARSFTKVQASGYDLEIMDADGRTTFHGYLNENAFERAYVPGVRNGFYASMAVGIVAALAYVAEDAALDRYLDEELVTKRDLPRIASEDLVEVNLGLMANFSNYNMAFTGLWLGTRYLPNVVGRALLRISLEQAIYDVPDSTRQPLEMKQSFFDFIYAAGLADVRPGQVAKRPFDQGAIARGLETLREFPEAPHWDFGVMNCDEAELAAKLCTLVDGTVVHIADGAGRGGGVIAVEPIPMRVRPPSNYHWRSNPYAPNGDGDGSRLIPGADFRAAYWLGRFVRGER